MGSKYAEEDNVAVTTPGIQTIPLIARQRQCDRLARVQAARAFLSSSTCSRCVHRRARAAHSAPFALWNVHDSCAVGPNSTMLQRLFALLLYCAHRNATVVGHKVVTVLAAHIVCGLSLLLVVAGKSAGFQSL
jgi:hypothetical protein